MKRLPSLALFAFVACSNAPSKEEQCSGVIDVVTVEMKQSEAMGNKAGEELTGAVLAAYAKDLRTAHARLGEIKVSDPKLSSAVRDYREGVTKLADSYEAAAKAIDVPSEDGAPAGLGIVASGATVAQARVDIAKACGP